MEDYENDDNGTIDRATLENELTKVNDEIAAYKRRKAARRDDQEGAPSWIVTLEGEWTRISREVQEAREHNQQLQGQQLKASLQQLQALNGPNSMHRLFLYKMDVKVL